MTPNLPTSQLPVIPAEKSIDAWLSEIPALDETGSLIGLESDDYLQTLLSAPMPSIVRDVPEDFFKILSQLDFTLPPPASVGDTFEGDLLGWGLVDNEEKTGTLQSESNV